MKIRKGMHNKNKDGGFCFRGGKLYTWELSKLNLENENIKQGDSFSKL
ncbi:hypothetical protein ACSXAK_15355 (plasmid) [Clostridium perfringens]